jgi:hypothetical protein
VSKPQRLIKHYGRGSLLGVLSLPAAWLLASRGATGWQEKAQRDMEKDVPEMMRKGYRVVSTEERQVPAFGMYWLDVTYELVDRNHAVG